jgi:hypothetical protein
VVCKFVVMSKLCERPGCSNPGEAAYGMVAEDLLFWIEPLDRHPAGTANVLCRRHADAMTVPRGWTLDDRRQAGGPRLFQPQRFAGAEPAAEASRRSRSRGAAGHRGEQLQLDGTGEIPRPELAPDQLAPDDLTDADLAVTEPADGPPSDEAPWVPAFDTDDDLDGLLKVSSPLLSRAFRGDQRPR